jgi:NitT/TauT family transport system substrate-binding protein
MQEEPPALTRVAHAQKGEPDINRIVSRRSIQVVISVLCTAIPGLPLAACGPASAGSPGPTEVRVGYLPNMTNAPALVALEHGHFSARLGTGARLSGQAFSAGPAEVEAIFGGAIDVGFLGPNPAINAYARSHGDALRVVAGASSGGASLVVRPGARIKAAADLKGRTIASPELGNTQDVALRAYLADHGFRTEPDGSGDVKVLTSDNATTLQLFRQGQVDGAWLPEPWASRVVLEAGGTRLLDERELWPGGDFPTTVVVASRSFLEAHPRAVEAILEGELDGLEYMVKEPAAARALVDRVIKRQTGKALKPATRDAAWERVSFTADPLSEAFNRDAGNAVRTHLSRKSSLEDLFDLRALNRVLRARGNPPVTASGLGKE